MRSGGRCVYFAPSPPSHTRREQVTPPLCSNEKSLKTLPFALCLDQNLEEMWLRFPATRHTHVRMVDALGSLQQEDRVGEMPNGCVCRGCSLFDRSCMSCLSHAASRLLGPPATRAAEQTDRPLKSEEKKRRKKHSENEYLPFCRHNGTHRAQLYTYGCWRMEMFSLACILVGRDL